MRRGARAAWMAARGGRPELLGECKRKNGFDSFRDDAEWPEDVLLADEREDDEPRENVQADEPERREEPRPYGGPRCPHDREAAEELERHEDEEECHRDRIDVLPIARMWIPPSAKRRNAARIRRLRTRSHRTSG